MGYNKRRTSRKTVDDKIRYIRMAAVPLIVVIVLVIIIVVMDRKPEGQETGELTETVSVQAEDNGSSAEGGGGSGESIEPDNSQYTTDFSQYELQKDAVPQVNQIISDYFQAKVDQDAEKLFTLFGKATDDESLETRRQELQNEAVYIEDYEDIVCYTKPGLTEESYVVYVTYNVKFKRVDTLAPGLMWCYVLKEDGGNFIIREHVMGEEADYVAKQNQTEDVRLLSNQVNERLRQAIESDTLLAGIYKDLRNGAVVSSSEGEEEGEDSFISLEEGSQTESSPQVSSGETTDGSEDQDTGAESGGVQESPGGSEGQGAAETSSGSGEDSRITIE